LHLWDLRSRMAKAIPTPHGSVRGLSFAPGRSSMRAVVLYNVRVSSNTHFIG
jgi:hypothetical protein